MPGSTPGTRPLLAPMHGLTGFVIRRLLLGLVTLFVTSVIIFAATQALPGDAARSILGRSATPESLAELQTSARARQAGGHAVLGVDLRSPDRRSRDVAGERPARDGGDRRAARLLALPDAHRSSDQRAARDPARRRQRSPTGQRVRPDDIGRHPRPRRRSPSSSSASRSPSSSRRRCSSGSRRWP